MRIQYLAVAIVATLVACSSNLPDSTTPRVAVFGAWQLNHEATDSLEGDRDDERTRRPRGLPMPAGMPWSGRFPGGMPGGPTTMGDTEDFFEMLRVRDVWLRNTDDIVLTQTGDGVRITYGHAAPIDFKTNGEKVKHTLRAFDDVESTAEWHDANLRIDHKIGLVRIQETYARIPGSDRLVQTVRIMGGVPRPIDVRRVYEPKS